MKTVKVKLEVLKDKKLTAKKIVKGWVKEAKERYK